MDEDEAQPQMQIQLPPWSEPLQSAAQEALHEDEMCPHLQQQIMGGGGIVTATLTMQKPGVRNDKPVPERSTSRRTTRSRNSGSHGAGGHRLTFTKKAKYTVKQLEFHKEMQEAMKKQKQRTKAAAHQGEERTSVPPNRSPEEGRARKGKHATVKAPPEISSPAGYRAPPWLLDGKGAVCNASLLPRQLDASTVDVPVGLHVDLQARASSHLDEEDDEEYHEAMYGQQQGGHHHHHHQEEEEEEEGVHAGRNEGQNPFSSPPPLGSHNSKYFPSPAQVLTPQQYHAATPHSQRLQGSASGQRHPMHGPGHSSVSSRVQLAPSPSTPYADLYRAHSSPSTARQHPTHQMAFADDDGMNSAVLPSPVRSTAASSPPPRQQQQQQRRGRGSSASSFIDHAASVSLLEVKAKALVEQYGMSLKSAVKVLSRPPLRTPPPFFTD